MPPFAEHASATVVAQLHVPSLRSEGVHRDSVAEFFERDGQRRRSPPLMLMDGEAFRVGVGGRSGSVDQDEHA